MRGLPILFSAWVAAFAAITWPASAGTITVVSAGDSGVGTLRTAIANAANGDVINFALTYPVTIFLTNGELLVDKNITIAGPGAANLTISGNNGGRIFHVGPSNTATISAVTILDGLVTAGGVGAGIYLESATLTLSGCTVRSNRATGGTTAHGGGIYGTQSTLNVFNCTLDSNVAGGNGGGIYNLGSIVTVDKSTITGNSAVNGGGVFSGSGTVSLTNSLVYTNTATHGGGIANLGTLGSATLTINNCTLSSNTVSGASATGSQIHNARQLTTTSATISNSTVLSNNVAANYAGGAVYNENGAITTIGNTIIHASSQEHTLLNVGAGSITSAGYNLALDNGNGFLTQPTDLINTDPLLDIGTGPRDNGGPTFTIALQGNSPAIDKGKRNAMAMLAVPIDQRGEPRPFNDPNIANASGGDASDIGAYEADLRLTRLIRMTSDLQFSFTSIVGKTYQLQDRSSLVSGNWTSFGNMAAGNGGLTQLTATNAFAPTRQFFRVLQTP